MIHKKEIGGEKHHAHDHDDRRAFNVVRRRKGRLIQFGSSLFDKFADPFFVLSFDRSYSF